MLIDIAEAEGTLRCWEDVLDPGRKLDAELRILLASRIRAHWISAAGAWGQAARRRREQTRALDRAERAARSP